MTSQPFLKCFYVFFWLSRPLLSSQNEHTCTLVLQNEQKDPPWPTYVYIYIIGRCVFPGKSYETWIRQQKQYLWVSFNETSGGKLCMNPMNPRQKFSTLKKHHTNGLKKRLSNLRITILVWNLSLHLLWITYKEVSWLSNIFLAKIRLLVQSQVSCTPRTMWVFQEVQ